MLRRLRGLHQQGSMVYFPTLVCVCRHTTFSFVSLSLADIQQKDREVLELLQERVTLFSDLAEVTGGQSVTVPTNSRNIFRADTPYAPQAERLLNDAIVEGKQRSVRHTEIQSLVPTDIKTALLFMSNFSGQTE